MSNAGVTITSTWNGEIIKSLAKQFMDASLESIGANAEGQMKELAPRRYGYLAASINYQGKDFGSKVESPSKYSKATPPENYHVPTLKEIEKPSGANEVRIGTALEDESWSAEFGTKAHDITVNTAKVLSDGKNVYGTVVHHPGTEATPFARPTMDYIQGKIPEIVERQGKKVFKEYMTWNQLRTVYGQTNEAFGE